LSILTVEPISSGAYKGGSAKEVTYNPRMTGPDDALIAVLNPYTGKSVGSVPAMTEDQVKAVIDEAFNYCQSSMGEAWRDIRINNVRNWTLLERYSSRGFSG
jgi:acyl-CoA reductase-like NAD-dependent aldehyde dehydrogenase